MPCTQTYHLRRGDESVPGNDNEYTYAINPESMKSYSVDDDELYATLNRDGQSHRWIGSRGCTYNAVPETCRGIDDDPYRPFLPGEFYNVMPTVWLRVGALEEELVAVDVPLLITSGTDDIKRKKQLTEQEKYKCAQDVCGRIAADISGLTDQNFITLWNIWNVGGAANYADGGEDKNEKRTKKEPDRDPEGGRRPDELEENDQKQHGDSKPSENGQNSVRLPNRR
ncbi:hypothetical protein GQ600_9090 [Phytophthora cactorum]|nr:hypothetical protein GQ600_9090 [Phytophthora cactorum]